MSSQGKIHSFFITALTSQGLRSLAQEALRGIDHLFVLQGRSGRTKTAILRRISKEVVGKGHDVELLCSSMDSVLLEGLIVPTLRMAIVDGPTCLVDRTRGQGLEIDLDVYCDRQKLQARRAEIESAEAEVTAHLDQATAHFKRAKQLHDQVEAHHVPGLDFAKADAKAEALMAEIFTGVGEGTGKPQVRSFFAVAWFPDTGSMVDFRLQATDDCSRRYILKGKPGTGKAVLARKIANAANERGYDTVLYNCNRDPNSLDGVVIPALSTAILDGTPAHTLEPQRPGDKIVDMLECANLEHVDQEAIQTLQSRKQRISTGTQKHLAAANEARRRLESLYAEVMDDAAIEQVVQVLTDRIKML